MHNGAAMGSVQTGAMEIAPLAQAIRARLGPRVVDALQDAVAAQLDDLAAELTELYQAKIPVYERFDPVVIRDNTRLVLKVVTDQLGDDSQPLTTDGLAELARRLAEQGIPLEPVGHSVQLGARRIAGLLRDQADELGVPPADLAAMQDLAWEWATEGAAVIHSVQQEVAVLGAGRRADFVRRIVAGGVPPAELSAQASVHQVEPQQRYHVACLTAPEGGSLADVVTVLRVQGGTAGTPAVDAVVDGLVVALLPRRPDSWRQPVAVGIGPAVELAHAPTSYDQARRALAIAERHQLTGVLDLAGLGPLPLLDGAGEAAQLLVERHLLPLRRLGATGTDILQTVVSYLAHDRRVDETAAELHLHRNSVRHRLTRFTDTTGLDLDRTDDFVVAWWLLHRLGPEASPWPGRRA